jgi:hypothetical protein
MLALLDIVVGVFVVGEMMNFPADSITSAAAYWLGLYILAPLFALSAATTILFACRAPDEPVAIGCALIMPIFVIIVIVLTSVLNFIG